MRTQPISRPPRFTSDGTTTGVAEKLPGSYSDEWRPKPPRVGIGVTAIHVTKGNLWVGCGGQSRWP